MAEIKEELFKYLRDHRLVRAQVAGRVYPQVAPSSAVSPFVTVQRIASEGAPHTRAQSGYVTASFQIDAWDTSAVGVTAVSESVREALDGFYGQWDEVSVRRCILENESDDYSPADDASQVGDYRVRMDFEIVYLRSIPTFPLGRV